MISNISINNKRAFSLLEMTIVIIIATVILTVAVPSFYRMYLEKAATKTALEIQNIQDAARAYYLQPGNPGWPTSITPVAGVSTDLESSGFVPSGWTALNPFGNSYAIDNPTLSQLRVTTVVPTGAQNVVASKLPWSTTTPTTGGYKITSIISEPGGPTTPPVSVFTGTVGNGGVIPLPTGYTDAQCKWMVSGYNALSYDSSGHGGCESLQTISTYLTGPNGRTAVAWTSGDCRGSWGFSLNYMGICLNS